MTSRHSTDDEQDVSCEDSRCGEGYPLWRCVDCASTYCSACWPLQVPHKVGKKGRHGIAHQKVDLEVSGRLQRILNPPSTIGEIRKLHEADQETTWFGINRDVLGRMVLEDYGRYLAMMSDTQIQTVDTRFPQLVSFISVTNAGKSTLIKMLVERGNRSRTSPFPSPVAGSITHDTLATSGDVHLYADPATYLKRTPLMFADCEGFEGGEKAPLGSRIRNDSQEDRGDANNWVNRRLVQWADTGECRRREHAVTVLYPRILYTFSDCVVFVLRNPKTFGSSVLTKLLEWGADALEKSVNQPGLPHCLVVVNGSSPEVDSENWNVEHATQALLDSVDKALDRHEGVPQFQSLAHHWRRAGKDISTVQELILCYYSSFKVIRIPASPQYTLIEEQVGKLHTAIQENCRKSHETKRHARLLANSDELEMYYQSGFDHFTKHLHRPFNFMRVALLHHPIPQDFGEHILQLCSVISSRAPFQNAKVIRSIFEALSWMTASCVMLDCARSRKGRVKALIEDYVNFFEHAVTEYLDVHCSCAYVSLDGMRRCMLAKARHGVKGHQDERGIIAAGDYIETFDDSFEEHWKKQVKDAAYELQDSLDRLGRNAGRRPEREIAFELHVTNLDAFYQSIGPAQFIQSHSTCFCCLMNDPQHIISCGHALCDDCVHDCGVSGKTSTTVTWCPLHRTTTQRSQATIIKYKPREAGVRVLSLDGGGIRGVVQLQILRAIEETLPIPIQAFFDLFVGTGTGGLIAVALGQEGKSIDQCRDMFEAVCNLAYGSTSILRVLTPGRPRYPAGPLYHGLKTAFTPDNDFFGPPRSSYLSGRVAVTASTTAGRRITLLANYRRAHPEKESTYDFERTHDPAAEPKTWQVLFAAMAEPSHFVPLHCGKACAGGGRTCANPVLVAVTEARRIWSQDPELVVSLGTGQDREAVLEALEPIPEGSKHKRISVRLSEKFPKSRRGGDIIDAERTWDEFSGTVPEGPCGAFECRRFRLNPDLAGMDPPSHDQLGELCRLSDIIPEELSKFKRYTTINRLARYLLASTFYFETNRKVSIRRAGWTITGHILCRLEAGSKYAKSLGQYLIRLCGERTDRHGHRGGLELVFFVKHWRATDIRMKVTVTSQSLMQLGKDGIFDSREVTFEVDEDYSIEWKPQDANSSETFPISGFPRRLVRSHLVRPPPHNNMQEDRGNNDKRGQVQTPAGDTGKAVRRSPSSSFFEDLKSQMKKHSFLKSGYFPTGQTQGKTPVDLANIRFKDLPPPYEESEVEAL